jgi:hypothetical protein
VPSPRKPFGIPLPAPLGDISEAAGLDAAMKLSLERGGARFNIPATDSDTELVRIVGEVAARAIVACLGGERHYIPLAKKHLIWWLDDQGLSQEKIAVRLKCSRKHVQDVLNPPEQPRQFTLFQTP